MQLGVEVLTNIRIKVALRGEHVRTWEEVERDFNECEYKTLRDRQMKELELEDDFLNKVPVRYVLPHQSEVFRADAYHGSNLRLKLHKESYEFVRQQRIHCLTQGAWFMNAASQSMAAKEAVRRPNKPWRFMRLVCNHLVLIGVEINFKFRIPATSICTTLIARSSFRSDAELRISPKE